jgi:DNA-binding transcriptional LysR family regulator
VLHISQPSATKMLQELELVFGCTLVDRTTRGGTLSGAGERVLERLRIVTGALDALDQGLASQAERPLVRIGMLPLAGVSLVPRLIAALSAKGQLPRLQLLEGSVSSLLNILRQGQIDCVIGRSDTQGTHRYENEFDIVPLTDERLEVASGRNNPLVRTRKLSLQRLRDQTWIVPTRDTYNRKVFDAAFVSMGLAPPHQQVESPSFHTSLAPVAESDLLTIAPRSAVDYYVELGKVRKLRLIHPFQADYIVFITLKSPVKLPALRLIQTTLQQLAG